MFRFDRETSWILGQTHKSCRGVVGLLRKQGHVIEETPEGEQAAAIYGCF